MANQLKKSLVFMAMAMLVMAYTVSAARLLADVPAKVEGTAQVGTIEVQGHEDLSGCVTAGDPLNVKACGSLTKPTETTLQTPDGNW
ncbi:hypothetical protein BVRB_5g101320 [Beta vulgaris subsp. vulgaris]|nr:hypothetical protein BVRB_5g101320 [Beta vulgaris subsp. vulgaris]